MSPLIEDLEVRDRKNLYISPAGLKEVSYHEFYICKEMDSANNDVSMKEETPAPADTCNV